MPGGGNNTGERTVCWQEKDSIQTGCDYLYYWLSRQNNGFRGKGASTI